MVDKVKVQFEIDDKLALKAIQNLSGGIDKMSKEGAKSFSFLGRQFDVFVGNLAAQGVARALDGIRQGFVDSFEQSKKFETGLINVARTTNFTKDEIEKFSVEIDKLTSIVPVTSEALLETSKIAGQLGVTGSKNILNFAETIAKLGQVSDLEGEFAASTLARILNVTREGTDNIDKFASVIVSLGNNFAATESEIANVTSEVARASAQFGFASADAAALSTALRSIGVRAEEAGTVVSKSLLAIQSAVNKGGDELRQLEKITGKTGAELKKQFKEDAVGVFNSFLEGLQKLEGKNADLAKELAAVGIEGIRVNKVLPNLARNFDELQRAQRLANAEMENATALNDEFNKALDSTEAQSQLLSNAVERLQRKIGDGLTGAFKAATPLLIEFISGLTESRTETFARNTEDVKTLTKELELLRNKLVAVKADGEISFFEADPKDLERDINAIQNRINELDTKAAQDQIKLLQNQLINLRDTKVELPIFEGILPKDQNLEEQENLIKEKIENLKNFIALKNGELNQINADARQADLENLQASEENKDLILSELREARKIREQELTEAEALAVQANRDKDFELLQESLGRKEAAETLFRVKQLAADGKQTEARRKLNQDLERAEKLKAQRELKISQDLSRAKLQLAVASANSLVQLSGASGKAQFALQKAVAFGQAIVLGRLAVAQAAAAAPPPANIPLIAAQEKINALNLGTIAAASVGELAGGKFANGGFVSGPRVGDKNRVNVNGDEAILSPSQQRRFMDIANGVEDRSSNSDIANALNNLADAVRSEKSINIDGREIFKTVQDQLNSGSEFKDIGVA